MREGGGGYGSSGRARLAGVREAFGVPGMVIGAGFLGFGALVHDSGFALWHGLVSTATGWALPGQIALVELAAAGASLAAIAVAVALTNARLLPMTVVIMPLLRAPGTARWRYYLAAHLVAVTGWAAAMRRCPQIPAGERLPYFVGFSATLWAITLVATAAGFLAAGAVPRVVSLGLVFVNPIYFMLVFAGDVRRRARAAAMLAGAVLGPALHLASPEWGLMATGLAAGTLAVAGDRLWRRGRA